MNTRRRHQGEKPLEIAAKSIALQKDPEGFEVQWYGVKGILRLLTH